jgi:hypothetical protein
LFTIQSGRVKISGVVRRRMGAREDGRACSPSGRHGRTERRRSHLESGRFTLWDCV